MISDNFWNIRGSFKIGRLVDVGTHASLVRLQSGKFVFLDTYTLAPDIKAAVDELTDGGAAIEAIINLHPFHTLYVEALWQQYPDVKLYGTQRHQTHLPALPWQPLTTDDPAFHAQYADDFDFSVPAGVELIPANEHVHFGSVLALHRASGTVHVDDTFMVVRLPLAMGAWGPPNYLGLHPTLWQALEKRTAAAAEFRAWLEQLANDWGDAEHLCAAHTGTLSFSGKASDALGERMRNALRHVGLTLAAHRRIYG